MSAPIVVGVDGSEPAQAALRWAVEESRLRGAGLVALHAWSFIPAQPIGDPGLLAVPAGDIAGQLDAESEAAREVLSAAVSSVPPGSGVEIEQRLVEGEAGDALVAASESAELVVVGSHGRSGLGAVLLGSVSRHVVSHAVSPVVVVKAAREGS